MRAGTAADFKEDNVRWNLVNSEDEGATSGLLLAMIFVQAGVCALIGTGVGLGMCGLAGPGRRHGARRLCVRGPDQRSTGVETGASSGVCRPYLRAARRLAPNKHTAARGD